jgi:hypothetical protein
MSIEYTYEIISVDPTARCMEVVYSATGHPTMHIGTRLPYEGETLEAVIQMYAPVAYWQELSQPVVVPSIGTTGTVAATVVPAVVQPEDSSSVINLTITDV